MTTINAILLTILFILATAIYWLARRLKATQKQNNTLADKNSELRRYLTTMNSELDCREAELMDLAQDPNSLTGVKYRTQAEIKRNRMLTPM